MRTPGNRFFLYDIGNQEQILLAFLRSVGVDTLSAVILSHPDLDHFGAFAALLREFPIKRIVLPSGNSQDWAWQNLLRDLDVYHAQKDTLFLGDTLIFDRGVSAKVLWPPKHAPYLDNNLSAVIRVEYLSKAVLLTGDIEQEGESEILSAHENLQSDILKVAHHGSRTSSQLPFLAVTSPRWAVISCDSTVYGHPHPETMADLKQIMGADDGILRTDQAGSVGFEISERGIRRMSAEEFVPNNMPRLVKHAHGDST